jgi:hypothetical protein
MKHGIQEAKLSGLVSLKRQSMAFDELERGARYNISKEALCCFKSDQKVWRIVRPKQNITGEGNHWQAGP